MINQTHHRHASALRIEYVTRDGAHFFERAGFDVGIAGDATQREALFHGAVYRHDGQGRFEF